MTSETRETRENARREAQTILAQLGGNKFIAMTGATKIGWEYDAETGNSQFHCMFKGSKKTNLLIVVLDYATDTYRMIFKSFRNYKITDKDVFENVYCDMLQNIFTEVTGLSLSGYWYSETIA